MTTLVSIVARVVSIGKGLPEMQRWWLGLSGAIPAFYLLILHPVSFLLGGIVYLLIGGMLSTLWLLSVGMAAASALRLTGLPWGLAAVLIAIVLGVGPLILRDALCRQEFG